MDISLYMNDFRANEKTFSLLTQVLGRSGRGEKKGRAVIQTYSPEHYAVEMSKKHDYKGFYDYEILTRKAMRYPPFCEIVTVLFSGPGEKNVSEAAKRYAKHILPLKSTAEGVQILGPIPATVSKINNKFRWRILIKCSNADAVSPALSEAKNEIYKDYNFRDVSVVIDKNPNNAF